MRLSQKVLSQIPVHDELVLPPPTIFQMPERVLQFGTGVLLRGLPDYFIDKANRAGLFNGRIVVVKSTEGSTEEFEQQDGLYTLCIRGVENEITIKETVLCSAISRVLSAIKDWPAILHCAHNQDLRLIISNTTEVGIVYEKESLQYGVPHSFPAKLLAFLYERFRAFKGKPGSGLVIIPTELIVNNGSRLREIVYQLAQENKLEASFMTWLSESNHFCNSLVDRIVPGKLPASDRKALEEKFGYTDELMMMAENFRLWAIESDNPVVKEVLGFASVDKGIVVSPDIEKFRELKLRLLNGTHTFTCGLAFLAGFQTVREALADEKVMLFVRELMLSGITPAILNDRISRTEAEFFANTVMDRFRNPFLDHRWISITLNFTSKMRSRNIPLLRWYQEQGKEVPSTMALGFAAYLLFMRCERNAEGTYVGVVNGQTYTVQDDQAPHFAEIWRESTPEKLVKTVLSNKELWEIDLNLLDDFANKVERYLNSLLLLGAAKTIANRDIPKNIESNEAPGSQS